MKFYKMKVILVLISYKEDTILRRRTDAKIHAKGTVTAGIKFYNTPTIQVIIQLPFFLTYFSDILIADYFQLD
jgi:hypothetical protein